MNYIVPVPKQFVDYSGLPYEGGTVSVYRHGTQELATIYTEAETDTVETNPCELDSSGAWNAFVKGDEPLDYIVNDKYGNVVASYMNVAIPGNGVSKEYVDRGDAENAEALLNHAESPTAHADIRQEIEDLVQRGLMVVNGQVRFG